MENELEFLVVDKIKELYPNKPYCSGDNKQIIFTVKTIINLIEDLLNTSLRGIRQKSEKTHSYKKGTYLNFGPVPNVLQVSLEEKVNLVPNEDFSFVTNSGLISIRKNSGWYRFYKPGDYFTILYEYGYEPEKIPVFILESIIKLVVFRAESSALNPLFIKEKFGSEYEYNAADFSLLKDYESSILDVLLRKYGFPQNVYGVKIRGIRV